jgi:phosphoribosylformylglycinamidine synthase
VIWHVNRLLEAPARLAEFQVFCVPGGFSYGDDLSAGRIFGSKIVHRLADALSDFRAAGKLILGICNGFQVLLKTDLLAPPDAAGPTATLAFNDSGRFECRWVRLAVQPGNCVFLQGIHELELPVAHAEGRFVTRDAAVFAKLEQAGRFVTRYVAQPEAITHSSFDIRHSSFPSAIPPAPVPYPDNPNGAMGNVAGLCDESGRVFGLMPHPERYVDATQHPEWTRNANSNGQGAGLKVFENAIRYFS